MHVQRLSGHKRTFRQNFGGIVISQHSNFPTACFTLSGPTVSVINLRLNEKSDGFDTGEEVQVVVCLFGGSLPHPTANNAIKPCSWRELGHSQRCSRRNMGAKKNFARMFRREQRWL